MSISDYDELRAKRAAENQSLFREVNERIERLNESFAAAAEATDWVCECADTSCMERISMTLGEYEALRRVSNSFAVVPGHEMLEVELVVEEQNGYLVVSKVGAGAELARKLDPRADKRWL